MSKNKNTGTEQNEQNEMPQEVLAEGVQTSEQMKRLIDQMLASDPQTVILISVNPDGKLNINTNLSVSGIHHILNRTLFEVILHERAQGA